MEREDSLCRQQAGFPHRSLIVDEATAYHEGIPGHHMQHFTFHDEMLNGGVLPLDLLDARTNSWIQAQKLLPKSAASN